MGNLKHGSNKYLLLEINNHGNLCTVLKHRFYLNSIDLIDIFVILQGSPR